MLLLYFLNTIAPVGPLFAGVKIVETVTSWKQLESSQAGRPKRQLAFYLLFAAGLIFVGSLPFVDNYAQIGGLVFGMVAACLFLPYITFSCGGKWTLAGRKTCLGLGIFFLVVLLLLCKDVTCAHTTRTFLRDRAERYFVYFQAHSFHQPPIHPPSTPTRRLAHSLMVPCSQFLADIVLFYAIQDTDICPDCHKFNCADFCTRLVCIVSWSILVDPFAPACNVAALPYQLPLCWLTPPLLLLFPLLQGLPPMRAVRRTGKTACERSEDSM